MSLFGSSGGYSKQFKSARDSYLGDMHGLADYYRNPATFQQGMAMFGEGYDRNLSNQRAATGLGLSRRGFSGQGATGLFSRQRARDFGMAGQGLNQQLRSGYEGALGRYGNALQGFQQSYYKAPSQGVFGTLAGMAGQFMGGAGGGLGGPVGTPGINPSSPIPYQQPQYPAPVEWWNQPGLPYRG